VNHLSLFSGSGIGTLAAKAAGIVTVANAENDPACCYCLERLWPDARLFRDVRDVTAESVSDLGPIDIISGGFPCQDVSTAGKGEGLGTEESPTRSGLWYEFARIIRETRPAWLLIENVPALRVRGGDRVCEDLESMAYEWEAVVVGADDVGAPHRRKRVWIVGRLAHADTSTGSAESQQQASGSRRKARTRRGSQPVGSSELGHAPRNDERRAPVAAMHGAGESAGRSSGGSGLADSIGELCGRGGNDSERGPQGGTAVGRAGETVADASGKRERKPDHEARPEPRSGHARQDVGGDSGGELADGTRQQRDERADGDGTGLSRWPARPGEPQHDWEAPRLIEFGLGDAIDGIPRRVRSRANKAALRMVGNAWCYENAVLMFRAIVELQTNLDTHPAAPVD
jgi:DNA (cytosine-5)-methyltransferase 1